MQYDNTVYFGAILFYLFYKPSIKRRKKSFQTPNETEKNEICKFETQFMEEKIVTRFDTSFQFQYNCSSVLSLLIHSYIQFNRQFSLFFFVSHSHRINHLHSFVLCYFLTTIIILCFHFFWFNHSYLRIPMKYLTSYSFSITGRILQVLGINNYMYHRYMG